MESIGLDLHKRESLQASNAPGLSRPTGERERRAEQHLEQQWHVRTARTTIITRDSVTKGRSTEGMSVGVCEPCRVLVRASASARSQTSA